MTSLIIFQLQNSLSRSIDEKNDLLAQRQQLELHIAHMNDQNQQVSNDLFALQKLLLCTYKIVGGGNLI